MRKPADIEGEMKTLDVNGRIFQYKRFCNIGEYGDSEWTEFYDGLEAKQKRKFIFFGEIITYTIPKFVFRVPYNIEDPNHLKSAVRKTIESYVELLGRQEEINKGEII